MKYSVIIAGDILPNPPVYEPFVKGDLGSIIDKPVLDLFSKADFSIVNLEGAMTDCEIKQKKVGPSLKTPKATVHGFVAMGVNAVALANNHITDYLNQGVIDTVETMENAGIQTLGVGKSNSVKTYLSTKVGNRKVCIYNVAECFYNRPDGNTYGASLYDEYVVCNEIKELKQQHDYLIVIYHGGVEYLQYPTPMVVARFHRMAECGADFITAQHTHCIGCEEYYNGSYFLYGQGNFFHPRQKNRLDVTPHGLIIEISFDDSGVEIIKHKVRTENDHLYYEDNPDFTQFYERGSHVRDEEYLTAEYRKLMFEVSPQYYATKYLAASKGHFPLSRLFKKLLPKQFNQFLLKSYEMGQLEQVLRQTTSDRARENYEVMWRYMIQMQDERSKGD